MTRTRGRCFSFFPDDWFDVEDVEDSTDSANERLLADLVIGGGVGLSSSGSWTTTDLRASDEGDCCLFASVFRLSWRSSGESVFDFGVETLLGIGAGPFFDATTFSFFSIGTFSFFVAFFFSSPSGDSALGLEEKRLNLLKDLAGRVGSSVAGSTTGGGVGREVGGESGSETMTAKGSGAGLFLELTRMERPGERPFFEGSLDWRRDG